MGLSGTPSIASGAVLLTLADPALDTDIDMDMKVNCSPPASAANRLRDRAGNEAESFTGQAVAPTDTTPAVLVGAEIDGDTMTIYFNEALDEDLAGNGDYFRSTIDHRGATHRTAANVSPRITSLPPSRGGCTSTASRRRWSV